MTNKNVKNDIRSKIKVHFHQKRSVLVLLYSIENIAYSHRKKIPFMDTQETDKKMHIVLLPEICDKIDKIEIL